MLADAPFTSKPDARRRQAQPEQVRTTGGSATLAGVSAGYDREALEARFDGDPDWLLDLRLAALDVYESTPLPTTRLEEWRYTDPRLLKWDQVELPPLSDAPAV